MTNFTVMNWVSCSLNAAGTFDITFWTTAPLKLKRMRHWPGCKDPAFQLEITLHMVENSGAVVLVLLAKVTAPCFSKWKSLNPALMC